VGDADAIDRSDSLLKQIEPFVEGKERLFFLVMCDGHNHFVEQFPSPLDHIEVSIRYRIETAWVNRASHFEESNSKPQTSNA
jgi:hypothetical protein